MDDRVLLMSHQVAERVTDRGLLQKSGRELVEQRLEGVVVVAVDEHDLGVRVLELLRGADTREPSAENEHPRARAGRGDAVA
jgi:hypothetical protein